MSSTLPPPASFAELINRWENMAVFAEETKQPYERVKRWRALNNIRPRYWPMVKAAAWARGWGWVDDAYLARLAVAASQAESAA